MGANMALFGGARHSSYTRDTPDLERLAADAARTCAFSTKQFWLCLVEQGIGKAELIMHVIHDMA